MFLVPEKEPYANANLIDRTLIWIEIASQRYNG
jgi:hypothetical protein